MRAFPRDHTPTHSPTPPHTRTLTLTHTHTFQVRAFDEQVVKLKKALKIERKKYKDLAASILAEGRDAEGGGGRGEGPAYLAAQGFQEEEEVKLFRISEISIFLVFLELGFHRFQSNWAIGGQ